MNFAGQFIFISSFGRLLQSYSGGEMHASQETQNCGTEERWNVYVWPDGRLSLQNYSNNKFLSDTDYTEVKCSAAQVGDWEYWKLYAVNNKVVLKGCHNFWLTAQAPGDNTQYGGEVIANRSAGSPPGAWEQFQMVPSAGIQMVNNSWWNTVCTIVQAAEQLAPVIVPITG
jgi:hypothetical protein